MAIAPCNEYNGLIYFATVGETLTYSIIVSIDSGDLINLNNQEKYGARKKERNPEPVSTI
jgi:hypothetical protein